MELILNDYAICGQFKEISDFEEYFIYNLNPVLDVMLDKQMPLYKKSDTFSRLLTSEISLDDYLRRRNDTVATLIKQYVINMAYSEPYWDVDGLCRTKADTDYVYPGSYDEPNCFTEAIEREVPLLSILSDQFNQKEIKGMKSGQEVTISNIIDLKSLLDTYLKVTPEEIRYIMEKYPFEKKVVLSEVKERCYVEEALLENGLTYEDKRKILQNISNLIEDKASGRKTHWWSSVEGEISEYRVSVSDNREFRLFFLWKDNIVFLNGFIKKTKETPEGEKKKAREIVKGWMIE